MKKLIISTIVAAGFASGVLAQGTVNLSNSGVSPITTNGTAVGNISGGAGNFYFALLTSGIYNGSTLPAGGTSQILNGTFQFTGVYGTNTATAGRLATGGSVAGQPTTSSGSFAWPVYQTNDYILVGWSVNEGTSWSVVSNELATGTWAAVGWFGFSVVGDQAAGGVDPNTSLEVNPATIFGAAADQGAGGLNPIPGFQLNVVGTVVPEPSTMALAGLGGLSMLLFRRKK